MSPEHPLIIDLNPRERRVYDRLRAQIVEPEPGERSNVRDLLLLLPDLAVLLFRLMRDDRVPVGSKAIAVLGGAYLISPIDLVPAMLVGPIGLVDDLIVVGAVLSRMLNRVHP
ncbi:MAG: YkvA family protein, partial [Myxococcota bacterium]